MRVFFLFFLNGKKALDNGNLCIRYNIQLALQTLRTILALGYQISMDKPPARIRSVRLPNEPYLQSNG